jgi:hypothetical protein
MTPDQLSTHKHVWCWCGRGDASDPVHCVDCGAEEMPPKYDHSRMPDLLRGIAPRAGSVWEWEPLKPHARTTVTVVASKWNGEACWVETMTPDGKLQWNELDRWVEAAVLIRPPLEDE